MIDFFRWGVPEMLAYLWLLPVLALLHLWAMRARRRALETFCPDLTARRTGLPSLLRRRSFKFLLFSAGVTFLIIALAQPMVGLKKQKARHRGAEVVVAIDTSLSMAAADMEPDRLSAAKHAATTIISRMSNDRVGIVVFAGDAYKYCPLTVDHDAALMFLDSIGLDSSPKPGTALADALHICGETLKMAEGKHRAVVLLTDGEDHGGGALDAANALNRETGAHIIVLGVGTAEGEPIPVIQADGSVSDFKRDSDGQIVMSRLDEVGLKKLADAGNGLYQRLGEPGAVTRIADRIKSLEGIQVGTYVYTDYDQRFQWPLAIAILMFAIEALVAEQKPHARRRSEIAHL
jgi:Ca-activated chloride channel homolog